VIHALHTNELPFINGGEHVTAIPEISTAVSLAVIVGTLLVTTVASLAKGRAERGAAAEQPRELTPRA
jgi:tellurite resistance protein TerC